MFLMETKKAITLRFNALVRAFENKASAAQPGRFTADPDFTYETIAVMKAIRGHFSPEAFERAKTVDEFFVQHSVGPARMGEFQERAATARDLLERESR